MSRVLDELALEKVSSYTDSDIDSLDTALQTTLETYSDTNSIGVGQTWQDVTASRAVGVTYTNSTGKPIEVNVSGKSAATTYNGGYTVSGISHITDGDSDAGLNGGGGKFGFQFTVPDGESYQVNLTTATMLVWSELR